MKSDRTPDDGPAIDFTCCHERVLLSVLVQKPLVEFEDVTPSSRDQKNTHGASQETRLKSRVL